MFHVKPPIQITIGLAAVLDLKNISLVQMIINKLKVHIMSESSRRVRKFERMFPNADLFGDKLISQNSSKPLVIRSVCDWHPPTIVGHYYTECPNCGFLAIEVKQTDV